MFIVATDKSQASTYNTPSPMTNSPTYSTSNSYNQVDATTVINDEYSTDAPDITTKSYSFTPTRPAENFTRNTLQGTELPTDPIPSIFNEVSKLKLKRIIKITTKKNPDGWYIEISCVKTYISSNESFRTRLRSYSMAGQHY